MEGSNRNRGLIVVLSGPAGVGKTTIGNKLLELESGIVRSVSETTRPPRLTEEDGVDYHFVPKERFERDIAQDRFAEYAEVFGEYYGTPCDYLDSIIDTGKSCLLIIDVQGGIQIKSRYPEALLIFVLPPSEEELRRRLGQRGTESPEEIEKRLVVARREIQVSEQYDRNIVNEVVEDAVREVAQAIEGARRD